MKAFALWVSAKGIVEIPLVEIIFYAHLGPTCLIKVAPGGSVSVPAQYDSNADSTFEHKMQEMSGSG